jgi:hypothetical protein
MKQKRSFWGAAILHPFLFALYPLLALWGTNVSQIPPFAISRAVFLLLIFLALSLGFSLLLFRSRIKAAVSTSLLMLLLLTYGHVFALVDMQSIAGFVFGRHRFMLALWAGIAIVGLGLLWRTKKPPYRLNLILNTVSAFLVVLALAGIFTYEARSGFTRFTVKGSSANKQSARQVTSPVDGPDVYYLLIDGFANPDILKEQGGPDVSAFIDQLKQLGFYVVSCAQDNYDHTRPSLASSLNMDYLEALDLPLNLNRDSVPAYQEAISHSQSRSAFESMGYKFVTFKPVYTFLNIPDSDYYYDADDVTPFYNKLEVVNFQYLFLSTTILRPLMEAQVLAPKSFERLPTPILQLLYPKASLFTTREYKQYQQNLYSLQKLSEVPGLPGKKFVYAHLFMTHQPYVFNPDGSFRWPPKDDEKAYFAQIEYTSKRLPEVLKKILQDSKTPPVIIVQSDHGYVNSPKRVKIINAYYLPDGGEKDLYPNITPVNSFRVVLNRYFSGNYPLLKDQTFHIVDDTHFQTVPNECANSAP